MEEVQEKLELEPGLELQLRHHKVVGWAVQHAIISFLRFIQWTYMETYTSPPLWGGGRWCVGTGALRKRGRRWR